MTDIVKQIGGRIVKPKGREMTHADLTEVFDNRMPSPHVLEDVVHHYNLIVYAMKERAGKNGKTDPTEEECRKLAFLRRMAIAHRRFGITAEALKKLEDATWLEGR